MNTVIEGRRKAISNILRQFRTFVDLETRTYKLEESLLGIFRWGKFKSLPKINYVLIFRSLFVKCEPCSFTEEEDNPNAYFQVSLVYNNNRRIIFHETRIKAEAFDIGKSLALGLSSRLRDSATNPRHGKWVPIASNV